MNAKKENMRGAGVLLSVTSLPAGFGIGDFGPEAYAFADMLHKNRQKYWQLLPLNPTQTINGNSPYSSVSSMAGNKLLISPELLHKDGLLNENEMNEHRLPITDKADYAVAEREKEKLFDKAWGNFKHGANPGLQKQFDDFRNQEAYWLNDFVLFVLLKDQHDKKPWNEWEEVYKNRDTKTLQQFATKNKDLADKVSWQQFIFLKQWKELRAYCNKLGIKLFGDLPFYVSYDSVDVWSHRDIFCLDEGGNMYAIAGVPPDYFSKDGQLWGMPTFKWDILERRNYDWWVNRLKKNLELFDLLRIDHFRAMDEYWQVPAGEQTAINGEWLKGPGTHFFDIMKQQLGSAPFVAEDLGDKMETVYELRDKVGLPGMKVLQFAFGENLPTAVDAPHNFTSTQFICYTGTHDNNTCKGWLKAETGNGEIDRLQRYLGMEVHEDDIHIILGRMAYASVAEVAILPVQDILGLDEQARMNTPSTANGNWQWRLLPGQFDDTAQNRIYEWATLYNRT